jgi:hypothetical protein
MTQENGHGHLQRRADDVRRPRGRANCAARPRRRQGTPVSLRLPFDQAQAVAMTLPSLLARALQSLTGSPDARYVFPLDRWFVELSRQHDGSLLTLATNDGFEVSFGIPAEASKGLGLTLAGGPERLANGTRQNRRRWSRTEPALTSALRVAAWPRPDTPATTRCGYWCIVSCRNGTAGELIVAPRWSTRSIAGGERACRGTFARPPRADLYFRASLTASRPAWAHSSSWSAVPPLTPSPPTWTLSAVMIGSPPANATIPGTRATPGSAPPLRSLP